MWWFLAQTREAMLRARQQELRQYNISARHASVLFIIQAIGETATPAEIARWLFRKRHSVSELLRRLETQGLVRRVKGLQRKNQVNVLLTEKGREVYQQSTKRHSVHRILHVLSKEQRRQLRSCLHLLRRQALKELRIEDQIYFPPSR